MIIHSAHLCAFAHGPQLIFFILFFRVPHIQAYAKVRSDYPSGTEYTFLQQQKRMKKREIFLLHERRWMDDSTTPMTLGTDCLNPLLSLPSTYLVMIKIYLFSFHFLRA